MYWLKYSSTLRLTEYYRWGWLHSPKTRAIWRTNRSLTCWNTLVELQLETFDDTMSDAETEVRVHRQADTLALVKAKPLCNTLGNLEAEVEVNTLGETLLNVETTQLATHWAMGKPKH